MELPTPDALGAKIRRNKEIKDTEMEKLIKDKAQEVLKKAMDELGTGTVRVIDLVFESFEVRDQARKELLALNSISCETDYYDLIYPPDVTSLNASLKVHQRAGLRQGKSYKD